MRIFRLLGSTAALSRARAPHSGALSTCRRCFASPRCGPVSHLFPPFVAHSKRQNAVANGRKCLRWVETPFGPSGRVCASKNRSECGNGAKPRQEGEPKTRSFWRDYGRRVIHTSVHCESNGRKSREGQR